MRIAIAGAGAVGGVLAGMLLEGDRHEVSVLARGPHLDAIRTRGLVVETGGRRIEARPAASDRAELLGVQDFVIVTAKGHSMASIAPSVRQMMGRDTVVIAAQNGIPWWYLHGIEGPDGGQALPAVDPDGVVWQSLDRERVVGAVLDLPARLAGPGLVVHEGAACRIAIGAPRAGDHTGSIQSLIEVLRGAAIDAVAVDDIRRALWSKLVVNLTVGPVSVLFGIPVGPILRSADLAVVRTRVVQEAVAVANAWGTFPDVDLRAVIEGPLGPGASQAFHPSRLRDRSAPGARLHSGRRGRPRDAPQRGCANDRNPSLPGTRAHRDAHGVLTP